MTLLKLNKPISTLWRQTICFFGLLVWNSGIIFYIYVTGDHRDVWPGLKTASAPSVSRGEIPGPNRTLVHYAYHTQSSSVIIPMYLQEPQGSSCVCQGGADGSL